MHALPKIWFLRHGQTYWNAESRIQGQLESDLTEQGQADARQQAKLMAPILRENPACYASPLGRAQQTARIALSDRAFLTDARLAEAHAGEWQGRLRPEIERDFPDRAHTSMTALDLFLAAPGSEGFDRFQARINAFLQDLSGPSVVVAHGLLGQVLRGIVCGVAPSDMGRLSNQQGCVYVLDNGAEQVLQ
jgi:broad specificity phosphatase PhoE